MRIMTVHVGAQPSSSLRHPHLVGTCLPLTCYHTSPRMGFSLSMANTHAIYLLLACLGGTGRGRRVAGGTCPTPPPTKWAVGMCLTSSLNILGYIFYVERGGARGVRLFSATTSLRACWLQRTKRRQRRYSA